MCSGCPPIDRLLKSRKPRKIAKKKEKKKKNAKKASSPYLNLNYPSLKAIVLAGSASTTYKLARTTKFRSVHQKL